MLIQRFLKPEKLRDESEVLEVNQAWILKTLHEKSGKWFSAQLISCLASNGLIGLCS